MEQPTLQTIWQEFKEPLRHFIISRVSHEQDAEDILQDIFIKVHNHLPHLKEEEKFQPWVFQITRNTIIDFYRSRSKDQAKFKVLEQELLQENHTVHENINELIATWLKDLVQQLPEHYKNALIYVEFQGNSQKEYAKEYGLSLSGAKSRVQRARKKLQSMLLDCCQLHFDKIGNVIDYKINVGNCSCNEILEKNK